MADLKDEINNLKHRVPPSESKALQEMRRQIQYLKVANARLQAEKADLEKMVCQSHQGWEDVFALSQQWYECP